MSSADCRIPLALAMILMPGCTMGTHGTLLARRTVTDSAEVIQTYNLGLQLRAQAPDRGWTFGYREATYFYPKDPSEPPGQQWSWFRIALPPGTPTVRGNTTVGAEIQATPEIQRIALGYVDQLLTVGPAPGRSVRFDFHYVRTNVAATRLSLVETLETSP